MSIGKPAINPAQARLIGPGIPDFEVNHLVESYNHYWGFSPLTYDLLRRRLDTDNIFIAAYLEDEPIGLLETLAQRIDGIAIHLPEYDTQEDLLSTVIFEYCRRLKQEFRELTNHGKWTSMPKEPNYLNLVDITVRKEAREKVKGIPDTIIRYAKLLVAEQAGVTLAPLDELFIPTMSPDEEKVKIMHMRNNAVDTHYKLPYFRKGHSKESVNVMCYCAPYLPLRL